MNDEQIVEPRMRVFPSIQMMKAARRELGSPAALNESLVATGIDALFFLLDGGTAEFEGTTYRLVPAGGEAEDE